MVWLAWLGGSSSLWQGFIGKLEGWVSKSWLFVFLDGNPCIDQHPHSQCQDVSRDKGWVIEVTTQNRFVC